MEKVSEDVSSEETKVDEILNADLSAIKTDVLVGLVPDSCDVTTYTLGESKMETAETETAETVSQTAVSEGTLLKSAVSSKEVLPPKLSPKLNKQQKHKFIRTNITTRRRMMHTSGRTSTYPTKQQTKPREISTINKEISPKLIKKSNLKTPVRKSPFSPKRTINKPLIKTSEESSLESKKEQRSYSVNRRSKHYQTFNKRLAVRDLQISKKKPSQPISKPRLSSSLPADLSTCTAVPNFPHLRKNVNRAAELNKLPLVSVGMRSKPPLDHQQMLKRNVHSPHIFNRLKNRYLSPKTKRVPLQQIEVRKGLNYNKNDARQSLSLPNHLSLISLEIKAEEKEEKNISGDHRIWSKLPPDGRSRPAGISTHTKELMQPKGFSGQPTATFTRNVRKVSSKENSTSNRLMPPSKTSGRTFRLNRKRSPSQTTNKGLPQAGSRGTPKNNQNVYVDQTILLRSSSRPKSRIGVNLSLRSSSLGAPNERPSRKNYHNDFQTAQWLKFQSERWRIKSSSSGMFGTGTRNVAMKGNNDCFAAWELTQNEVLQSCRSEDLLIMKNALSESAQYSCNQQYILQNLKANTTTPQSDDSFNETKRTSHHRHSKKIHDSSGLTQNRPGSAKMNLIGFVKEKKTPSVHTNANDTSLGSTGWSITSSTCSNISPKKSKRSSSKNTSKERHNKKEKDHLNSSVKTTPSHQKSGRKHRERQRRSKRDTERMKQNMSKFDMFTKNAMNNSTPNANLQPRQLKTSLGFSESKHLQTECAQEDISRCNLEKQMQEVSMQCHIFLPTSDSEFNTDGAVEVQSNQSNIEGNNVNCKKKETSWTDTVGSENTPNHQKNHANGRLTPAISSSTQSINELLTFYKEHILKNLGPKKCSRFEIEEDKQASSRFIRTETRKAASDALKCAHSFRKPRKTPLGVWKWRLFSFTFVMLLIICHYMAFLATTATV